MALNYYDLNRVTIENRFAPWTHGHSIDAITNLRAELDATQSGLTSSSNILFNNATVYGNIVPNTSGAQNLGAADKHWGSAWIDELHLATNTLYLGDTPVIGTDADIINIKADADQGITIKTTGTGESKLISENGVEISTSGLNGQIAVQSTGPGGQVSFGATSSINFTAPAATFSGDIDVNGNATFDTATFTGDVTFQGTNIVMNTTEFTARDNRITLNSGEQGSGVTAIYAGFQIDRGTAEDWQFVFNETTDQFQFGPVAGVQQIVVSKAYVDAADALKLNVSAYTAADVFAKVLTLDGAGSGLDADTLQGYGPSAFLNPPAQDLMDIIQTVDGSGSLLDADFLDGYDSTYFAPQATTYTKTEVDNAIANLVGAAPAALDTLNELAAALGDDPNFATTVTNDIAAKLDSSAYTAADVLAKLITVDGAGTGLDADLLDGQQGSYYAVATHTHNGVYLPIAGVAADSSKLGGVVAATYLRSDINGDFTTLTGSTLICPNIKGAGTQLAIAGGNMNLTSVATAEKVYIGGEGGVDVYSSIANSGTPDYHAVLIDANGNSSFPGIITATSFNGSLSGNATSANVLSTARTISLSGDVNGSVSFNGSANVTITATVADDSHNHTIENVDGLQTALDAKLSTTGKAADSNLLDGLDSGSFLRSDATDYINSTLYTRADIVAETDYRDHGIFGTYDSTKTQHIWSMGTAYRNAADGSSFGNLYGLAYKYEGSAGSHGTYHVINGTATCGFGTNVWTSGVFDGVATSAYYADLAEKYTIAGTGFGSGDVVLIGGNEKDCIISNTTSSSAVLGVISTNPAFMMNKELENGHYVALKGRVPCKVFGRVAKGEPLVSHVNGTAIGINNPLAQNTDQPGVIFAKALEASDSDTVKTIEVVVL